MKAILVIAVRRGVRASDDNGRMYTVLQRHEIEAPVDWQQRQLAAAISLAQVQQAMTLLAGLKSDELDTIEFTVDFEDTGGLHLTVVEVATLFELLEPLAPGADPPPISDGEAGLLDRMHAALDVNLKTGEDA